MASKELTATVSRLPYRDGDGYSYGGEAIVTIGEQSILIGSGGDAFDLAKEIARRWNNTKEGGTHGQ